MRESRKIARGSLILFPEATDAMDEADELSAVIYLVSRFFPARYISIFHSFESQKVLQTLSSFAVITSVRSVEESNNTIKPIPSNDRIAVSARWIPIS